MEKKRRIKRKKHGIFWFQTKRLSAWFFSPTYFKISRASCFLFVCDEFWKWFISLCAWMCNKNVLRKLYIVHNVKRKVFWSNCVLSISDRICYLQCRGFNSVTKKCIRIIHMDTNTLFIVSAVLCWLAESDVSEIRD